MALNDYQFGLNSNAGAAWQPGVDPVVPPSPVNQYQFGLASDASAMQSQQFAQMPVVQPMAQTNQQVVAGQAPGMDYYAMLGAELKSAMQPPQPLQRSAPQMQGNAAGQNPGFLPGPGEQSVPFNSSGLTQGFNHDWLAKRLDAGSANGAAIGGVGKNPGGGKVATKDDGAKTSKELEQRQPRQQGVGVLRSDGLTEYPVEPNPNRQKFIDQTGENPEDVVDVNSWPWSIFGQRY